MMGELGVMATHVSGFLREVPVPWQESSPMSERLRFIQACLNRHEKIVDVCAGFGISEKTGQKYLARFKAFGEAGLVDRSHAPHHPRNQVAPGVAARIVELRKKHKQYGPVALRDWLVQHEPNQRWPASSTIGELLKRAGLIKTKRRRVATHARMAHGRTLATAANVVWTADFKGQFRLGTGAYCYPLTVLDLHSHFLLRCRALPTTAIGSARETFARVFAEHGLPTVLRTDNGVPFAQPNAIGRLGALAFWWIRLGIRPEHINLGRPAENGAHERFHKTLKAYTQRPPAPTFTAQQRRFDRFGLEYNTERPHASNPGHRPPARLYTTSTRPFPSRLPALLYPGATAVRHADPNGQIRWHNQAIFLSSNLAGEDVGLTETENDLVAIAYGALILGDFDPHTQRFTSNLRWVAE
jgi:putative transposase